MAAQLCKTASLNLLVVRPQGHIAMLYKVQRALFSGDHLAYSARIDRLSIFP